MPRKSEGSRNEYPATYSNFVDVRFGLPPSPPPVRKCPLFHHFGRTPHPPFVRTSLWKAPWAYSRKEPYLIALRRTIIRIISWHSYEARFEATAPKGLIKDEIDLTEGGES
jgi:hypothetical protein